MVGPDFFFFRLVTFVRFRISVFYRSWLECAKQKPFSAWLDTPGTRYDMNAKNTMFRSNPFRIFCKRTTWVGLAFHNGQTQFNRYFDTHTGFACHSGRCEQRSRLRYNDKLEISGICYYKMTMRIIKLLIIVLWILAFVVLIPAIPFLIILRIIFYLDILINNNQS